ncbi:hypothetical protein [Ornithinimicrobium sediminis]|uniref:hypothetical protein n=1 Tax=Ornithinimicrobium sediminis TaxID=2904603 RepID=UPI001E38475E|nr:hypothetical protein [Ornithinimicrobium sediminis]MCE0485880.1 hypothetical protein [Ornithinimicrobium sediminis]
MAVDPIVVEGDDAVVAITDITAYSTGLQVQVAVRTNPNEAEEGSAQPDDPMGEMGRPSPQPDSEDDLPEELLRIDVAYPDGQVASSAQQPEPEGPVLAFESSQSTLTSWDYEFWLWPLPESGEGDLQVTLAWPARGIDVTEPLDAERIDAAAQEVTTLWSE